MPDVYDRKLSRLQLKAIDDLSELIGKCKSRKMTNEMAYMIHQIINDDYFDFDRLAAFKVIVNEEMFFNDDTL